MKKILKEQPLHSFLIGLYFILFLFVRNMSQIPFSATYRSIAIELALTSVLFVVSYLLLRSVRKAGIFSTFVLLGFLTYGILYNYLEAIYYKGYWPFSHIHRFLIIAFLGAWSLVFFILYHSKRPHYKLNYILNVFVLVLLVSNLPAALLSGQKQKIVAQGSNPFLAVNSDGMRNSNSADSSFPDVYYIILDGYAGEKTLKDFYSDANPILYDYLRKKGFYLADSSRANYPFTAFSLSSSLNLGYLDSSVLKTMSPALVRDNTVNHVFKKAGYKRFAIESGFAVTENFSSVDKTIHTNTLNEFEFSLLQFTFLRLDEVLGFSQYQRLKNELDGLPLFLKEEGPKFCFIHIVSPHPPYVVDSVGHRKVRKTVSNMAWEPRDDYWQQLQYVSKRVMEFIDQVLAHSKTPPLVIVQSDHGPWIQDKNPGNVYEARSRILNAYYVPDSVKKFLYPQITPVNSFRVIFSQLLKTDYSLLPDRPYPYAELKKDVTFTKYNQ